MGAPTLTWYINPDDGGQAEIAGRCTDEADGAYRIETSLLPREASAQREQLARRLAANDSSIDLISMDPPYLTVEAQESGAAPKLTERRRRSRAPTVLTAERSPGFSHLRTVVSLLKSEVVDETRDQRALRASDADREHVADLLRQAASDGRLSLSELDERIDALFVAKTYGELEPVVEDLPGVFPERPQPARPPMASESAPVPVSSDRVGGVPAVSRRKAVFSGFAQRGEWVVPAHYQVKAVFGGAELDLREAQLAEHEVRIEIKAVFGGVNVVVPDDIHVVVDGDGYFGAFADEAGRRQPARGAPVVRIGGKAVFGGVNVRRKAMGEQ